jgi:23S rRNA (cytidine2498-2'-O)-methyltransferase
VTASLHLVQAGYEPFLAKEIAAQETGHGWVTSLEAPRETCFSQLALVGAEELKGPSVNAIAWALVDRFMASTKEERFEAPWPLVMEGAGADGVQRRAKSVAKEFSERLKSRMSRVAKLAAAGRPALGPARGFFAVLVDFDRAYFSREALSGGQRRMADDPQAPSRSYLKIEEAYGILGREPGREETVVDLGAAPGGWSYSAARRGARVVAVDNGPLKGGALHPLIEHRPEDAFTYRPARPVDWLFCDMVEDPERVLALVERWLKEGWCRRIIVNLKFGRTDPLPLLRRAEILRRRCPGLRARHLFHDREEFTLTGETGA